MIKAPDLLRSSIPGDPRLLVVTGDEAWFRDEVVAKYRATLPEGVEVQVIHGPASATERGPDLRELLDDLRTPSLFGGERLVHLRAADILVKENAEILTRFVGGTDLVHRLVIEGESLVARGAKSLPKSGFPAAAEKAGALVVTCDPLFDAPFGGRGPAWQSPLSRWVQERAQTVHGKRLNLETAWHLHRLAGTGLRELDAELGRLALYVRDRKEITEEDIDATTGAGRLAPVFEFAECVARRDAPAALEQSAMLFERGFADFGGRHVRDQSSVALALQAAVASRIRKVGRALELMAAGASFEEAAAQLRQNAMFLDRFRLQVEAWRHGPALGHALTALLDLERGVKTGADGRVLFDRFLVEAVARKKEGEAAWRR